MTRNNVTQLPVLYRVSTPISLDRDAAEPNYVEDHAASFSSPAVVAPLRMPSDSVCSWTVSLARDAFVDETATS